MPLQNRVNPFGEILALEGRGTLMGNRGVLCDEAQRIVRPWQSRRWITCVLEVPGRRRAVMQPGVWTGIFFLDEASAFAAGHRPCAACRYADYRRFQKIWIECFGEPARADDMDARLHADRLAGRAKRTHRADIAKLPRGTMLTEDGEAWLLEGEHVARWTMQGYVERRNRPSGVVEVLTPISLVAVLAAGYRPLFHPTAQAQ